MRNENLQGSSEPLPVYSLPLCCYCRGEWAGLHQMRVCGLGAWRGGEGRKRGNVCVQVWPGAQEDSAALTVSALLACIVCVGV